MASELRVDRIIPVDGVPSGGGGGIIQMKHSVVETQVVVNTNTWTSTGNSVTITPKSASNYFYVFFEGQFTMDVNGAQGFGYNIYKDGSAVTTSSNDGGKPYDEYKDETRIYTRKCKMYFAQCGTTSAVTFDVRFRPYNAQNTISCYSGETQQNLIVMEVSG